MMTETGECMQRKRKPLLIALILMIASAALGVGLARARHAAQPQSQPGSRLHPAFALLDINGQNVLQSGAPLSTMQTCGQCHDTDFIASHSFHTDLGLSDYQPGTGLDASPGAFGKWDPLTYRYLSQPGDERLDLGTPEWLMTVGLRHVGGGPAATARDGSALEALPPDAANPETAILNPDGSTQAWDWQQSGTIEMNCFLCHTANPDNEARTAAIQNGDFAWANTATLLSTGVVQQHGEELVWNPAAFDENGQLQKDYIFVQDPTNENCGLCHGVVDTHNDALVISDLSLHNPQTATTGQVISPQKIAESGMNIQGKDDLARSWDIHAERQLACTDCHFSLNNPAYAVRGNQPSHLLFDPRRLDTGEYLLRPDHNFARGQSAQYNLAPELKGTMRRCESCHDAATSHAGWLPYLERHMDEVACESCHIPQMYAPAIEAYDWTALTADGQPLKVYRGIAGGRGDVDTVTTLVTGFQPVLLPRQNIDGDTLLAPYNLITTWYWVYQDANGNTRPVRLADLDAAWFEGESYAPEVLAAFDNNGDNALDENELRLDSEAKQQVIAARLEALGLANVHIEGRVQPYSINHNVTEGQWAVRECTACHGANSRLSASIETAPYAPAGVQPEFAPSNVEYQGNLHINADGALVYTPNLQAEGLYVFGHSRLAWLDWLGALIFLGTLLAILAHSTLRYLASRKQTAHHGETQKVYMYSAYERLWHWLQVVAIVFLLLTGLVIHRPDLFGAFSFRNMVLVHNVLAAIMVLNAALALFYHLASGEIKGYIPRPRGFFDQAIVQARYYLGGIFRGEPHPFEKTPQRKFNPLQQITYFGLLNVLLPLQVITGALMWGAQRWTSVAEALGGLPWLAPFHSLIAWLLGTFIVAHVYLTTTAGPTVFSAIQAMIDGWEEVEL
ncbi:MAG: hypothetical protein D6803_09060 [Anaerolineae bacterium]|nr:MAG: hypothetical protein D6803_09060 [Anaerolineae bacterium]